MRRAPRMTACSRATTAATRCAATKRWQPLTTRWPRILRRRLVGEVTLADGRRARAGVRADGGALSRRELCAGAVAEQMRHRRRRPSGASPRSWRDAAFDAARSSSTIAWTDWAGRRHDKIIGRPVSMHAMRGISARIPTASRPAAPSICCRCCWARSIAPAASATSRRSRSRAAGRKPAAQAGTADACRCTDLPLGFPTGPEDLLLDVDGTPHAHRQGVFSWEAPLAAHGLMHMVIPTPGRGDPYPIDTLFLYMANMALELGDEHAGRPCAC